MNLRCGLIGLLALLCAPAQAQEFKFDAADYQSKAYELSGYLELRAERFTLDREAAFYGLRFFERPAPDRIDRFTALLKPSAKLKLGDALTAQARAHLEAQRDTVADSRSNRFDEAFLSYKPHPGLALDAGKVALKWGKAYAWNPVGFFERPKDPNDPELAREGFTLVSADFIRNFDGALQTVAFTPVLLPVSSSVNKDFGRPGHVNVGGKLYLLYRDTDIDFMFVNAGSRTRRYGFDFSRNIASQLEVHGEWARVQADQRPIIDARGAVQTPSANATSYVFGARYLTERETTVIAEYYRNGAGYGEAQFDDFYAAVETGLARFAAAGDRGLLSRAAALAQGPYGRPNAGRRYVYLRAAQKDPFDILYVTPAVTVIANLDDRSRSVAPELLYTGISNVELRVRAFFLSGGSRTEFGEKQNSRRIELMARIYF